MRRLASDGWPTWHSHTTSTDQPAARSFRAFVASRVRLRPIFVRQYSRRTAGMRHRPQECICQKHPFTLMILRLPENTMSGHPGSER